MALVHVRHPVPVRFVPRGARNERFTFRRGTAPVVLREVGYDQFTQVATLQGSRGLMQGQERPALPLYAFEGRLWTLLDDNTNALVPTHRGGGLVLGPKRPAELLPFLQGDLPWEGIRSDLLRRALYGSPLCARADLVNNFPEPLLHHPRDPSHRAQATAFLGEDEDLSTARAVVEDGSEQASAAVARFLQEGVVLAEGRVFMRTYGPLVHYTHGMLHLVRDRFEAADHSFVARLDRHAEYAALWHDHGEAEIHWALQEALQDIDPALLGDDDLHHAANVLPGRLMRRIVAVMRTAPETVESLRPALDALRPWFVRAMTGSIQASEGEPVVRLARATVDAMLGLDAVYGGGREALVTLARHIDRLVLPRYEAPALEAGDAEALGGLGL